MQVAEAAKRSYRKIGQPHNINGKIFWCELVVSYIVSDHLTELNSAEISERTKGDDTMYSNIRLNLMFEYIVSPPFVRPGVVT